MQFQSCGAGSIEPSEPMGGEPDSFRQRIQRGLGPILKPFEAGSTVCELMSSNQDLSDAVSQITAFTQTLGCSETQLETGLSNVVQELGMNDMQDPSAPVLGKNTSFRV